MELKIVTPFKTSKMHLQVNLKQIAAIYTAAKADVEGENDVAGIQINCRRRDWTCPWASGIHGESRRSCYWITHWLNC